MTVATRTGGGRGWRLGRVGERLGTKGALVLVMMKNKQIEWELETARRMAARAECHKAASKREAAKGNAAMAEWEVQQEGHCRALEAQYGSR